MKNVAIASKPVPTATPSLEPFGRCQREAEQDAILPLSVQPVAPGVAAALAWPHAGGARQRPDPARRVREEAVPRSRGPLFAILVVLGAVEQLGSAGPYPERFQGENEGGYGTYAWQVLLMIGVLVIAGALLLFWLFVSLSRLAYPAWYKDEMDRVYAERLRNLGTRPRAGC